MRQKTKRPVTNFQKHPSELLNNLYKQKNYQGANPKDATVLFVGRDPNWAIDIDGNKDIFEYITEYLKDGVSFWKKYNVHHPFLIHGYKGDGKRYHKIFSKLNLNSNVADKISFVELIGFPTTGMAKKNNKKYLSYLISGQNKSHLHELNELLNDSNKIIFIAWGLIEDFKLLYKETELFEKFSKLDKSGMNINKLNQFENIFTHRHFSDAISNVTISKILDKLVGHLQ